MRRNGADDIAALHVILEAEVVVRVAPEPAFRALMEVAARRTRRYRKVVDRVAATCWKSVVRSQLHL